MIVKYRIWISLNRERAKLLDCTDKEIEELEKELEHKKIALKYYYKANIPPELILIKSSFGEKGFVRKEPRYKEEKHTLVVEYPLSSSAEHQRRWIKHASTFFKPLFNKKIEYVNNAANFKAITKPPFLEEPVEYCDPDTWKTTAKFIIRKRKYIHKAPYGSKSYMPEFFKKRDAWLKKEYRKLLKNTPETKCYEPLKQKLYKLPSSFFGKNIIPGDRKPFDLSENRIKFLVQSKKNG